MIRLFNNRDLFRRATRLLPTLILICAFAHNASADEATRVLADKLGDFRAESAAREVNSTPHEPLNFADHRIVRGTARTYTIVVNSNRAEKLNVSFWQMQNDSSAYAYLTRSLTLLRNSSGQQAQRIDNLGTLGYGLPDRVQFFKGSFFVVVDGGMTEDSRLRLAREISGKMLAGDAEIPPLALSLPDWERVRDQVFYAVSKPALLEVIGKQAWLEAIDFNGGAEAATAKYEGGARLVIVEYNTPQIAADNDRRVAEQLAARNQTGDGDAAEKSAYKRVGNYLVFVFDATDKAAATALLERVKYEQVVRWLGDNPRALLEAQKAYGNTIATVIIGTIQGAGIALLLALFVGGAVGSFVFSRRRAQHTAAMAFSDAGGIVRLNIDHLSSSALTNDKLLSASPSADVDVLQDK